MLFTDLKCYHLFQILQKALVLNKAHRFPLEADRWGFFVDFVVVSHDPH